MVSGLFYSEYGKRCFTVDMVSFLFYGKLSVFMVSVLFYSEHGKRSILQ